MERRSWDEVAEKEGGDGVDLVQWGALGVEGRRRRGADGRPARSRMVSGLRARVVVVGESRKRRWCFISCSCDFGQNSVLDFRPPI
jgi:hypothetical protein